METAPRIELKDFFKNPEKSSYQISPDGKFYSYLAPYESRKNIHVENIATGETKRVTSQTDRDIAGYFWANNNDTVTGIVAENEIRCRPCSDYFGTLCEECEQTGCT